VAPRSGHPVRGDPTDEESSRGSLRPSPELPGLSALELRKLLIDRSVSAREVLQAHLEQVERVNPTLNALVTLTAERALERAIELDTAMVRSGAVGPLHGIPVAHKDLVEVKGVRTTYGSPLFADHVPDHDAAIVERMARAGAVSLGKTNVPEFGAGSQTFNQVFGATRNPYDPAKTAGGSSGGAAAALASGMVALADGSDMGGSLRNPASFCNVIGLRPTPGLVPTWPSGTSWVAYAVSGPMGRRVEDVALLLSVLAGDDPRAPFALPVEGDAFAPPLRVDVGSVRVAWSRNLGELPVTPAVTQALEAAGRPAMLGLGWTVEDIEPDFTGADEAFRTWRFWTRALELGELFGANRGAFRADLASDIESGLGLSGADLQRAEKLRGQVYARVQRLLCDFDVLACPVSPVPPFSVELPWVAEIDGVVQHTYLDWMRFAYFISVTGLPAVSLPCGFSDDGLPIGLQLVGRPRGDLRLLEIARSFEEATSAWRRRPDESTLLGANARDSR
jgi:amidase